MNIFNAAQIKAWDEFTIRKEGISSFQLMERAAGKCVDWIASRNLQDKTFRIFCGKGNNGGDGLIISRLLLQKGYQVHTYILEFGKLGTDDFQQGLQKLHDEAASIHFIQEQTNIPLITDEDVVIDALLGAGLNKPIDGLYAAVVNQINNSGALIISIDVPTGLFIDKSSKGNLIVRADHTLTFQSHKLGLLVADNASFIGEVHLLDIGLHKEYVANYENKFKLLDWSFIQQIFKPRQRFSHKGTYGHSLIIAGSYGKMGAAVLAVKSCLRTGVGLLSTYIPKCGYTIMQTSVPEAMSITDKAAAEISRIDMDLNKYDAIGAGPGIGTSKETAQVIYKVINNYRKAIVIDADGLNCLALDKTSLKQLPPYSVVTPHPKEFDRLFGDHQNDFERIETAIQKAKDLQIIVVLKGHHTLITTPDGAAFFNTTGNAGMATGGSGDVLTGIITSLVAQKYAPGEAALLGVYLHGLAGDIAAEHLSQESMTAGDIIDYLPQAFLKLNNR